MKTKMKTKSFDCVEMKRQAQEALLAEFDRRRDEYATLPAFIRAKIEESKWADAVWRRFAKKEAR